LTNLVERDSIYIPGDDLGIDWLKLCFSGESQLIEGLRQKSIKHFICQRRQSWCSS